MIYWIFHLLARICWADAAQWAIADLIRLALTSTRWPDGTAGSPIASVLANLKTKPIDRLVASPDMGSSTGIWSL
jgi:hypothetical protein